MRHSPLPFFFLPQDVTSGLKWGDHEHYLYQLVDANGELCVKGTSPPSVGSDIGADSNNGDPLKDDCSDGVYHLVVTVTVDGVTSAPIQILFARGVEMEGPATQSAFARLQQLEAESQQNAAATGGDNATSLGVAGLAVAVVAFLVASYAAFKKPPAVPKPQQQVEMAGEPAVNIN